MIANEIIEQIKSIDCSRNKKYTNWLICQYLIEPFDIQLIRNYILDYYYLLEKDIVSFNLKLKNIDDLITTVDNISSDAGYEEILNNDDVLIVKYTSYGQVIKHGRYITNKMFTVSYVILSSLYYCRIKNKEIENKIETDYFLFLYDKNNKRGYTNKNLKHELFNNLLWDLYFIDYFKYDKLDIQKNNLNNIKLLMQQEINSDLYLFPYDYDSININCKKINGNVILVHNFSEIPKFLKNIEIKGKFDCSKNVLKNLINCPQNVNIIDCSNNNITSLIGSPSYLNGDFICSRNELETLNNSPRIIGGEFRCNNNKIRTLIGSPIHVGELNCDNNVITSFVDIPKIDRSIHVYNNKIKSLKGLPNIINGDLFISKNNITTLKYAPSFIKNEIHFYVDESNLIDDYRPRYDNNGYLINEYNG